MQDLNFTPLKSPSATDINDGSACESLKSLEIRIIALDWIVLLRNMVRERILTEFEVNSLEWGDHVHFGRHNIIAPRWYMADKSTEIYRLEENKFIRLDTAKCVWMGFQIE